MKKIACLMSVALLFLLASCNKPFPEPLLATPIETGESTSSRAAQTMEALQTQAASPIQEDPSRRASIVLVVLFPDDSHVNFTYEELQALSVRTADLFDKPRPVIDLAQLLALATKNQPMPQTVTFQGIGSLTMIYTGGTGPGLYLDEGKTHFYSGDLPAEFWPQNIALIVFR